MKKFKLIFVLLTLCTLSAKAQNTTITIHQSGKLKTVLAAKTALDKTSKTSKYKIQLANGSKSFVDRTLGRFYAEFPNTPAHKVYESPEYKVRVGNYRSKLEAERALIFIRKKFPNAIIMKL